MTRIIIQQIDDATDLVSALAAVTRAFLDPSAFDADTWYFRKADPAPSDPELAGAEPGPQPLGLPPGLAGLGPWPEPDPFLPCPDRGTHERLTDCWMCWSDVHRGAAVETEVLRTSWDTGLARLLDLEDGG